MIWMRRGDCPAVFSLEILRRNPCTGEESAPRETGRGIQQIFKQTGAAFCSRNTFAPRNGIFIQIPQGLARRGFKNQNPARGRKLEIGADGEREGGKISKPYPRKGTETSGSVSGATIIQRFQNHIPARGRSVPPASPARAGEVAHAVCRRGRHERKL